MEFLWHLNDSPVRLIDHYKSTETSFSVHFTPSPSTRSIICRKSLKLPFILSQGQKTSKSAKPISGNGQECPHFTGSQQVASFLHPDDPRRSEIKNSWHLPTTTPSPTELPKKGKRQDDAAVNVGSGNTDMDRGRRSGDTRKALSWNCNLNWDTFFTAEDALHTPQPYFQRSTNARKMFYVESPSRLS